MSGEGTALWAVRGGGTGADQLYGVAVDSAGGVIGVGYSRSYRPITTATYGDAVLVEIGDDDAVMWKVSTPRKTNHTLYVWIEIGRAFDY